MHVVVVVVVKDMP